MDTQLRSARHGVAVTPSDTVDLPRTAQKGLYVTVTGNVSFITTGGDIVSLTAVPAFTTIPFAVKRVRLTGTVGTVLALY